MPIAVTPDKGAYFDRLVTRYSEGRHIAYKKFPNAKTGNCHANADDYCALHVQCTAVRGWLLSEWLPSADFLQYRCIAHSVVRESDGELIDVTPLYDEREMPAFVFLEHEGTADQFDELKASSACVCYPPFPSNMQGWQG